MQYMVLSLFFMQTAANVNAINLSKSRLVTARSDGIWKIMTKGAH